jgi:hypothetical protein
MITDRQFSGLINPLQTLTMNFSNVLFLQLYSIFFGLQNWTVLFNNSITRASDPAKQNYTLSFSLLQYDQSTSVR